MKAWIIAWQDTWIRLRDRNAFVLMLLAPIVVTAIMGAALGQLVSGGSPAPQELRIAVVNQDKGDLGKQFVKEMDADDIKPLVEIELTDDPRSAQESVISGDAQAYIHISQGFTENINHLYGENAEKADSSSQLQVYVLQSDRRTYDLVRNLTARIASRLADPTLGLQLGRHEINSHLSKIGQGGKIAGIDEKINRPSEVRNGFNIEMSEQASGSGTGVNPFAFFAPSMAIFFLMFTMFEAPRAILAERESGTLSRLLRTPTSSSQVLLGKLGGSYLTGILQFSVLVIVSSLIFNLKWGSSFLGLALMVISVVVAASSMGAIIAAFSTDVYQAELFGGAIAIVSAGLGGSFFPPDRLPAWLQVFSHLTINRWGLEGFTKLTMDGLGLRAVLFDAGVLLSVAALFFLLAFWKFQRRMMS